VVIRGNKTEKGVPCKGRARGHPEKDKKFLQDEGLGGCLSEWGEHKVGDQNGNATGWVKRGKLKKR